MIDTDRYLNTATYQLIDRVTGEEIDVDGFVERVQKNGWQKAYAKTLAEYIRCGDGRAVDILAYFLETKNQDNLITATQREIAKTLKVSVNIVTRTIKALTDKGLMRKVRSGCYMLDPQVLRYGSKPKGILLFRVWDDLKLDGEKIRE